MHRPSSATAATTTTSCTCGLTQQQNNPHHLHSSDHSHLPGPHHLHPPPFQPGRLRHRCLPHRVRPQSPLLPVHRHSGRSNSTLISVNHGSSHRTRHPGLDVGICRCQAQRNQECHHCHQRGGLGTAVRWPWVLRKYTCRLT